MSDTAAVSSPSPGVNTHEPGIQQQRPFFRFNFELDCFWDRCHHFVNNVNDRIGIHPLHIALTLLFDDLRSARDPWSHTKTSPPVLERSLFWLAISNVHVDLPNALNDHIHTLESKGDYSPLQMRIAEKLWRIIHSPDFQSACLPLAVQEIQHTVSSKGHRVHCITLFKLPTYAKNRLYPRIAVKTLVLSLSRPRNYPWSRYVG